jgi:sugar diacid utilization regulator
MAVEFATAARPLMHFSDIDLQEFVVRRSDGAAARLIPQWMRQVEQAEDEQSRQLMRTIRIFADCSLNVKQTAQRLDVHTNTVYFRLNRIGKLSGVNPRTYSGLSTLLTALRLLEVHAARSNEGSW